MRIVKMARGYGRNRKNMRWVGNWNQPIIPSGPHPADMIFDPLDVPPAEPLHLAAQLEVSRDLLIVQDAEAIDDCYRPARGADDGIGIEVEVRLVAHSEDKGVDAAQCLIQVFLDLEVHQLLLIPEESRLAL